MGDAGNDAGDLAQEERREEERERDWRSDDERNGMCRCGKPEAEPSPGCEWHAARAGWKFRIEIGQDGARVGEVEIMGTEHARTLSAILGGNGYDLNIRTVAR